MNLWSKETSPLSAGTAQQEKQHWSICSDRRKIWELPAVYSCGVWCSPQCAVRGKLETDLGNSSETIFFTVEEIYGIHSSGKYHDTRRIYNQMYRIYSDYQRFPVIPEKLLQKILIPDMIFLKPWGRKGRFPAKASVENQISSVHLNRLEKRECVWSPMGQRSARRWIVCINLRCKRKTSISIFYNLLNGWSYSPVWSREKIFRPYWRIRRIILTAGNISVGKGILQAF